MINEEWKVIENFSNYSISNLGSVKGLKSILKNRTRCGNYQTVDIKGDNGKYYSKRIHRLVAQEFIPNPESRKIVHHIDGNPSNNVVTNLEWVTQSKNIEYAVHSISEKRKIPIIQYSKDMVLIQKFNSAKDAAEKTGISNSNICRCCRNKCNSAGGFVWQYEDEKVVRVNEDTFKRVGNRYRVYKNGSIYNECYKQYMKPYVQKSGYPKVTLVYPDKKRKCMLIHRLVAMLFVPNPNNRKYVNHKDGDKLNCHMNNLEWVTFKENVNHAISTGLTPTQKKVAQYSLDGLFIKEFASITEAEREIGKGKSHISDVCNGKRNKSFGYNWRYV
jgi:hypothetical protein